MRPLRRPALVRSYTDPKAKRFRKLRKLQAWGMWARGALLEGIGRELGHLADPSRPLGKERARSLVWAGRRIVANRLGEAFVERVDADHRRRRRGCGPRYVA